MRPHGRLEAEPVRFDVADGQVSAISDPAIAAQVAEAAEAVGAAASNFAELGIGTNLGVTELV
ncbi:MAG: aminopeptidase, partial [Haloquadratum sp.]|nr:aminopeptidase [Haloquadratum sp.]